MVPECGKRRFVLQAIDREWGGAGGLLFEVRPVFQAGLFEVLCEKLPSLAVSAVKRILLHRGVIFETATHYIQHLSTA